MLNFVSQNNVSLIVNWWACVSWLPWLHLIPFMREGLITILCWGKLFQAFVKNFFIQDIVAPSKSPVYFSWIGLNNCMVIRFGSIEVQTMLIRHITSQMHDIGFWAPLKNGRVVLRILNRQTHTEFQFLCRVNFYANLEFILWVIYQYPADTELIGFGHLQVYLVHIFKMTSHNTHTNGLKWKSEWQLEWWETTVLLKEISTSSLVACSIVHCLGPPRLQCRLIVYRSQLNNH